MKVYSRVLVCVATCVCGLSGPAAAQQPEVRFMGATTGCFYTTTPCTNPTASATMNYLTFQ